MTTMAENALAPEQKLPKAPPELPDDEVLYELADLFRVFGDSTASRSSTPSTTMSCACRTLQMPFSSASRR